MGDHHRTDPDALWAVLDAVRPHPRTILDPGAGTGVLAQGVIEHLAARLASYNPSSPASPPEPPPAVTAVETDVQFDYPDTWEIVREDFIPWAEAMRPRWEGTGKNKKHLGRSWDLVVMNPPFRLPRLDAEGRPVVRKGRVVYRTTWLEWAMAALPLVAPGGQLLVFGTQGCLATKKRAAFYREQRPATIYQLVQRPSCSADGHKDARDYVWFHWRGPGGVAPLRTEFDWVGGAD